MLLKYTALASVTFAGLFAVFVVLRAETGSPCPYDDILIYAPREPDRVMNNHPPPYRGLARLPLAECAAVVDLDGGATAEPWLAQVQDAFRVESAVHGMNAVTVERFEHRPAAVIVAYTSYCSHRTAMTARLIAAFAHRFPDGPRLRDVTGQVAPDMLTVAYGLPLWPTGAQE